MPVTETVNEQWTSVDFTDPESGVWVADQVEREQWMGHKPGDKQPFSPWADPDAPVECNHHEETTTCAECGHSAQFKWGYEGNYTSHEEAATWAERDPRLAGLAFIQREDDPLAFVDGDDVRDPETNEVHPVFKAFLEQLGLTYADISVSGAGVHAVYRGELPEGVKQAVWEIDDEPWGANDGLPAIEIYDGKHVCIATGDHVRGTPRDAHEWDDDALEAILRANDQLGTRASAGDFEDFDASDYEATATSSSETTEDIRDIYAALDRLNAQRVAERTIVDEWIDPSHAEFRAFAPTWAESGYEGTANFVTRDVWKDTGTRGGKGGPACMAAIDAGLVSDRDCPERVNGQTWWQAVDHLRDLGFDIPEYATTKPDSDSEPTDRSTSPPVESDPLDLDITLDIGTAWRAASAVGPDDLADNFPIERHPETADAWSCPHCSNPIKDAVRALGVGKGDLDSCDAVFDDPDAYDRVYTTLRDQFEAPLPRYVTSATATEEMDLAYGAVGALRGWHILDAIDSKVTNDQPSGSEAVAEINPSWEESESGHRIVLFESGLFYCREHEVAFDPLRFVALEQGLITCEEADTALQGNDFLEIYRATRVEYGTNLPTLTWNRPDRDTAPEHVPVLPPPDDLIGEGVTTDADALRDARDAVEAEYGAIVDGAAGAYLLTVLPALGKTTSVIKHADEAPALYTCGRKELMQQAKENAEEHGVTAMYLPVLGTQPPQEKLEQAVAIVHEEGRDVLREREVLLERVGDWSEETDDEQASVDGEPEFDTLARKRLWEQKQAALERDEDVDLDRDSCGCGDGREGRAWQLVVHTARASGSHPRDIHASDTALFGDPLPCHADGECEYTAAWERATDPDAPIDLLIGHYVHAHVKGARAYRQRAENDFVDVEPRTIAMDEFPGDAFRETFGDEYLRHATWLASCLDEDVEDVQGLLEARERLWQDEFVQDWFRGEADPPAATAVRAMLDVLKDEDADPDAFEITHPDDMRVSGDLAALVDRAIDSFQKAPAEAEDILRVANRALTGGYDGVEALVTGASDGYAHPAGFYLLRAQLAPDKLDEDGDTVAVSQVIETPSFSFGDPDQNGTRLKRVCFQEAGREVRVLLDRNQEGAAIRKPPAFTVGDRRNTVVGLDATAFQRERIWNEAVGQDFERRDIHETARDRRAFLRNTMNLQVVQTSPHINSYEGSPANKNFDGDVALVDAVANEYTQEHFRQDRLAMASRPGVITTKVVKEVIEDRLVEAGAGIVGNFGNVTGSNAFGEHNVGVILGSQHYGDATLEEWAAFAGEEVEREGHGQGLDYNSEMANTFLEHMREDQVMQAVLRFGRDEEGAVVFAHTAALRDDLPVVGDGSVVRAFSETAKQVAQAAKTHVDETFEIGDIAPHVDASRRSIRRALNEFADLGHVRKTETPNGLANQFDLVDDPGPGEVELPDELEVPGGPGLENGGDEPGQSPLEEFNTGFVWVAGVSDSRPSRTGADETVLPAPESVVGGPPAD